MPGPHDLPGPSAGAPDPFAAVRARNEEVGLDEADLGPDPMVQLRRWYDQAAGAGLHLPEAAVLATASPDGVPSARYVLLRGLDGDGVTFYTDGRSAKAEDLLANPQAAVVLPWHPLQRQVRLVGPVRTVAPEVADAYFAGRPRGSQVGAWASHQSAELPDRAALEARVDEEVARWAGRAVERPPYWTGFRLVPDEVELWQGRADRLHDRLVYRRSPHSPSGWIIVRLSP